MNNFLIVQLEKAREATDEANIRAAYAEVMVNAVTEPSSTYIMNVELKQAQDDWQTTGVEDTLKGLVGTSNVTGSPTSTNKYAVVKYTKPATGQSEGTPSITFTDTKATASTGETLLD